VSGIGEDRFNSAIVAIHHAAMVSLGFLAAALMLGGPLGFCPAWAALLEESRAPGLPRPGAFWRITKRSGRLWRSSLPGSAVFAAGCGLVVLSIAVLQEPVSPLVLPAVVWMTMCGLHVGFLVSLGHVPIRPKPFLFTLLLSSWLHLIVVAGLVLLGVFSSTPALPLIIAFGPWAMATLHSRLEASLIRVFGKILHGI
jgi:hypothetical protein